MLEIPCTLRCDVCKNVKLVMAETRVIDSSFVYPNLVFIVTNETLPSGWQILAEKLHCPRCPGKVR